MVLSILFVSFRIVARLLIKRGLGWDDFWMTFGLLFGVIFLINVPIAIDSYGYKYHIWDLPPRLYKAAALLEIQGVLTFLLSTFGD